MMMATLMQQQQKNHPVAPTFEQCHAQKASLTIVPSFDDPPNLKFESTDYPLLSDWLKVWMITQHKAETIRIIVSGPFHCEQRDIFDSMTFISCPKKICVRLVIV